MPSGAAAASVSSAVTPTAGGRTWAIGVATAVTRPRVSDSTSERLTDIEVILSHPRP